jgi:hypothetical protein
MENNLFDEFKKEVVQINETLDSLVKKYDLSKGCIEIGWLFNELHIEIRPQTLFKNSEKFQDYYVHIDLNE